MIPRVKSIVFWIVVAVSATLLWEVVRAAPEDRTPEISYSRFMSDVEAGNVMSVTITGTQIRGQYLGGKGIFHLTGPSNPAVFLDTLRNKGVDVRFKDAQTGSIPLQLLGTWAPLILLAALWFFMIRQMQRRNSPPPGTMPPQGGDLGRFGGPR